MSESDLYSAARIALSQIERTGTLCITDKPTLLLRIAVQQADLARLTDERDEAVAAAAALRAAVETLTGQIRELQATPVSSVVRVITLRKE